VIVIPAVDIKGGVAVRLLQGRADRESLRAGSPLEAAKRWAAFAPKRLHVVDLDGAFEGRPANAPAIREIIAELAGLGVPVEVGGGIRTEDDARVYVEAGAERVIVGTRAAEDPAFVRSLAAAFPGRVDLGLDCSGGRVAVKGWVEATEMTGPELLRRLEGAPLGEVIYTDISTDGMLSGPNVGATREVARASAWPVIASGGVARLDDLVKLNDTGLFFGAIVGRALYTGAVDLGAAIERIEQVRGRAP
jgi:phosphoribosylformimino-5-aminoimidazole carboxamide ribotide isomerase